MKSHRWLALATFTLTSIACSGSDTSSTDLAGTWNVTKYELVNASDPSVKVNRISSGASATVVLKSDGTYQMTIKVPGQADEITTGTWSASMDVLTMRETGISGEMEFGYTLSGNTLTLAGADSDWDFNGDGTLESAKVNVTAVRG